MRHTLLASIFLGCWIVAPPQLLAIDVDIPGVVKVCDTCGGGLLGGSRPNTPWSAVEFLQGVAQGSGDPLLSRAAQNLDQFKKAISDEAQAAIDNAVKAQNKATSDVAQNLIKSANDIVDATAAVARYGEREVSGTIDVLSQAQQRVREGKVVDAMWHISTDSWQNTNKNAAQLAEENEIVSVAGQAVASAYGGPAGAAAYAAWLSYNKSGGNVDLALKAGVYAYVTASGAAATGSMPTDSVTDVAKKAALAGAVGGLAVAASGGSNEDILKAFVDSGSAVVVQSGQSYVSKNYTDTEPPRFDSYCVTAVNMSCADAKEWYDTSKKRLDDLKTLTSTSPTVKVTGDGDWAISWDKDAVAHPQDGSPAVALTYVGNGSPLNNVLRGIAAIGDPSKFSGHWVAYRDVGALDSFFDFTDPGQNRPTPIVGDNLRANRNINMRFSPADWTAASGLLSSGTEVKVLEVRVLSAAGTQQEWIRLQLPTPLSTQAR